MDISYRLLQAIVFAMTAVVFTASITCDKMIMPSAEKSTTGGSNPILEMGRYMVRTTQRTDTAPVKDLMSNLDGASDIKYKHKSFTAVLQPKDLKKVHMYNISAKYVAISN